MEGIYYIELYGKIYYLEIYGRNILYGKIILYGKNKLYGKNILWFICIYIYNIWKKYMY